VGCQGSLTYISMHADSRHWPDGKSCSGMGPTSKEGGTQVSRKSPSLLFTAICCTPALLLIHMLCPCTCLLHLLCTAEACPHHSCQRGGAQAY
jgi:hypothetical protein